MELDWHVLTDEALLDACWQVKALLVTNNVADFVMIARQWHLQGRLHAGLLFTSDTRWPRTRAASVHSLRRFSKRLRPRAPGAIGSIGLRGSSARRVQQGDRDHVVGQGPGLGQEVTKDHGSDTTDEFHHGSGPGLCGACLRD